LNPPIETERLLLRDLSPDDLPACVNIYADLAMTRFLGVTCSHAYTNRPFGVRPTR
jgi:hypothetical protein